MVVSSGTSLFELFCAPFFTFVQPRSGSSIPRRKTKIYPGGNKVFAALEEEEETKALS